MSEIATVVTEWHGATGPLAVTKMRFQRSDFGSWLAADTQNAAGVVNEFLTDLMPLFPAAVDFEVQDVCHVNDSVTGALLPDVMGTGPYTPVSGTSGAGFQAGSGLRVNWSTSTVLRGRHVRGGTYLIPAADDAFDALGLPSAAASVLIAGECTELLSEDVTHGLIFCIWSRPSIAHSYVGLAVPVTGGEMSAFPAGLRRRR